MMCVSCLSHEFPLSCSESPLENGEKRKLVSYLYQLSITSGNMSRKYLLRPQAMVNSLVKYFLT